MTREGLLNEQKKIFCIATDSYCACDCVISRYWCDRRENSERASGGKDALKTAGDTVR